MNEADTLKLARVRDWCRSGYARHLRKANGLSLREVAEAIEATIPTVWRWEQYGNPHRPDKGRKPTRAVGVRYARFLLQLASGDADAA